MGKSADADRRDWTAKERATRAVQLRLAGATYAEIQTALGYAHRSSAMRAYERGLDRLTLEPIAEARALELHRLDRMLRAVWSRVLDGHLGAIDRALAIGRARRKLLGLDAPDRVELTTAAVPDLEDAIAAIERDLTSRGVEVPDG